MTSRELEIFYAVMSSRSLTEAATSLGVSQPALSKALKRLEDRLRMPLFRRIKGRLYPTLEAEGLFPECARLVQEIARLSRTAMELRDGEAGLLRIAASASLGISVVPGAVAEFTKAFPTVKIVSHFVTAATAADLIVGNHVDIGMCLSPVSAPGCVTQSLAMVPMICAVHPDHPLAKKSVIGPRDLMDVKLISFGSNTYLGQLLDEAFERDGLERRIGIELMTAVQAPSLVRSGAGVALVDGYMQLAGFADICWRPFMPQVLLPVNIITSAKRPSSRLTHRFMETMAAAVAANQIKLQPARARRETDTSSQAPA